MNDSENNLNACIWKSSKTWLKSFLQNCLRYSLLNVLWITTLICCLGHFLFLEPLTDSPSLRPMRLRRLYTNFSPNVKFVRIVPSGCFCAFWPHKRSEATVLRWLRSSKQANRSKSLSHCTHWCSDWQYLRFFNLYYTRSLVCVPAGQHPPTYNLKSVFGTLFGHFEYLAVKFDKRRCFWLETGLPKWFWSSERLLDPRACSEASWSLPAFTNRDWLFWLHHWCCV